MATLYKVSTTSTNSTYYGILGKEMTADQYARFLLNRVQNPNDLGGQPNRLLIKKFSKATIEDTTAIIIQSDLTRQEANDLKSQYVHVRGTHYDNKNANTVAGVKHTEHQTSTAVAQAVADYTDPEGDYNDVYTLWLEATGKGYEINTSNLLHYLSDLHNIQRVLEEEPEDINYTLRAIKRNYGIM